MKILMIVTLLIVKTVAAEALEIKLPPKSSEWIDKQTLLGIDKNKNNVRDDVEIFIWNEITKEPKLYMAYLKFAETQCEQLKHVNDLENMGFYNSQESNDLSCISYYEKEEKISENTRSIYKLVHNTKARKKAIKQISKNYNLYGKSEKFTEKKDRYKLCRF